MKKLPKTKSVLEAMLFLQIKALKLPMPVQEYRFHQKRKWRLDFAWPELGIAAEVEGGTTPFYTTQKGQRVRVEKGRHVTPEGFEGDCEKYNAITESGMALYRFTGKMIKDGRAIKQLQRVLK